MATGEPCPEDAAGSGEGEMTEESVKFHSLRADLQLLREALGALDELGRWRPDSGEWHVKGCYFDADSKGHQHQCATARAAITKLEERLLRE